MSWLVECCKVELWAVEHDVVRLMVAVVNHQVFASQFAKVDPFPNEVVVGFSSAEM